MNDGILLAAALNIKHEIMRTFPKYAEQVERINFRIWSMSSSAGRAYHSQSLIKLSRSFYYNEENFAKKFRNTVLHEIAHILSPTRGHKKEWRTIAREIGCTGDRCHKLALADGFKKRRSRYVIARCQCREGRLPARKGVEYTCGYCKHPFKTVKEIMA